MFGIVCEKTLGEEERVGEKVVIDVVLDQLPQLRDESWGRCHFDSERLEK